MRMCEKAKAPSPCSNSVSSTENSYFWLTSAVPLPADPSLETLKHYTGHTGLRGTVRECCEKTCDCEKAVTGRLDGDERVK